MSRKSVANANLEVISTQHVTHRVQDYEWPPESGEKFVILEQFIGFLEVTGGFKRKFPHIQTRKLDTEEIKYLYKLEYLNEAQYSIGVSALPLADAVNLMKQEFPARHDEFLRYNLKQQRQAMKVAISAEEMPAQLKKAAKSVSDFNKMINLMRKESFQSYYDANSNRLHLPVRRYKKLADWQTRKSPYPVAVLAGQYQTDFKKYNTKELNKLPIKTVLNAPAVECTDLALTVFDDNDLIVDPMNELVSEDEELQEPEVEEEVTLEKESGIQEPQEVEKPAVIDDADNASVSSGVSDDTCCTCREKYDPEGSKFARCNICVRSSHLGCLGLTDEQHEVIQTYQWACIECKTCTVCAQSRNEEQILFCDRCDRGFHTFCVALRRIPKDEIWICRFCFKDDPGYSERRGGKKMRERRKKKALQEYMN